MGLNLLFFEGGLKRKSLPPLRKGGAQPRRSPFDELRMRFISLPLMLSLSKHEDRASHMQTRP